MRKQANVFFYLAFSFAILPGCSGAVSYGPVRTFTRWDGNSRIYGYSDVPLDSTTYQVTFTGDAPDANDRLSLYRAAELTDQHGYDYFIVTNPTRAEGSAIKTIRMHRGSMPPDNPNAYDAKSILATMGTAIPR